MSELRDEVPIFHKGEIVLCYEPDKSKARVLYTSKVLNVFERRNEHGLRYYDYKIHFQGWRPSYDRCVRAPVLVKDTEENRQLQRELAEAAQLQIRGDYSYKGTPDKPVTKKKRGGRGAHVEEPLGDPLDTGHLTAEQEMPPTQRSAVNRPRDNSGGNRKEKATPGDGRLKGSRGRLTETAHHNDIVDPNSECFVQQEDRIMMRVSERLREIIEYDRNMIKKLGKQHALPSRVPIVTIMENFVKQRAVELAIGIKQDSSRARNTQSRNARMEREYDRVMSNVCMLKEVVDGLRIYFEFHVDDHLLYKEEKEYIHNYLTDDNMRNCSLILNKSYDFINPNGDTDLIALDGTPVGGGSGNTNGQLDGGILGGTEYEKQLQKCLLYIVTSSGKNTAQAYERSSPYTAAYKLPMEMRGFLNETFKWRMLTAESPPEKSMVFGAPHLARLMLKMPIFLNASPISNKKLEDLLPHLDSFINYLENHREWFDKDNYVNTTAMPQEELQRELLDSLDGLAA
ncbi:protein male-specific lethal-3 [Drosophila eugracilis]|uniref:protein male-specific lethal-3 n=1 Tax=Drosophila eugracilis TaxID=29029 RepID=UPI0007E657B3|nr:protein male-specific lethal-3 [Drosophila eugracilis]